MTPSTPRKVLLLAYHFPPLGGAGSLRLLSFAKYLPDFGWEPIVVTVGEMGIAGEDPSVLGQLSHDITIHRWFTPIAGAWALRKKEAPRPTAKEAERAGGPTGPAAAAAPTRRAPRLRHVARRVVENLFAVPDHAILWSVASGIRMGNLMRSLGVDVFVTSSPPHSELAGGLIARQISAAAWVVDLRDPWRCGDRVVARNFRNAVGGWLEDTAVRNAQKVLANTPRLAESLSAGKGVDPRRIVVLPNGYDADAIGEAVRRVRARPRADGEPFTIVHAGTLYMGFREPYAILDAIARARQILGSEARPIRLVLAGESSYHHRPELKRRIVDLGLEDVVHMPGYLPHAEALALAASADLLLVIQEGESVSLQVPSKAYEYLALDRPVLCLARDGATADLVRQSPIGEVIAPGHIDGIADLLVRHNRQNRNIRGEHVHGSSLPPGVFSRKELAGRLAEVLEAVVSDRSR